MELSEAIDNTDSKELSRILFQNEDQVNLANTQTGDTALITACGKGRLDLVRLLLSKGADVTIRDVTGGSALHAAALRDHVDILQELHKHGVDLDAINSGGLSALHVAVKKGFILSTKTLLRLGARPNICDVTWQRTPLYDAVKLGNFRLAKLLLERDALVNCQDSTGLTPLHEAVADNNLHLARLLLKFGADINLKEDITMSSPLDQAQTSEMKQLLTIFEQRASRESLQNRYYSSGSDSGAHSMGDRRSYRGSHDNLLQGYVFSVASSTSLTDPTEYDTALDSFRTKHLERKSRRSASLEELSKSGKNVTAKPKRNIRRANYFAASTESLPESKPWENIKDEYPASIAGDRPEREISTSSATQNLRSKSMEHLPKLSKKYPAKYGKLDPNKTWKTKSLESLNSVGKEWKSLPRNHQGNSSGEEHIREYTEKAYDEFSEPQRGNFHKSIESWRHYPSELDEDKFTKHVLLHERPEWKTEHHTFDGKNTGRTQQKMMISSGLKGDYTFSKYKDDDTTVTSNPLLESFELGSSNSSSIYNTHSINENNFDSTEVEPDKHHKYEEFSSSHYGTGYDNNKESETEDEPPPVPIDTHPNAAQVTQKAFKHPSYASGDYTESNGFNTHQCPSEKNHYNSSNLESELTIPGGHPKNDLASISIDQNQSKKSQEDQITHSFENKLTGNLQMMGIGDNDSVINHDTDSYSEDPMLQSGTQIAEVCLTRSPSFGEHPICMTECWNSTESDNVQYQANHDDPDAIISREELYESNQKILQYINRVTSAAPLSESQIEQDSLSCSQCNPKGKGYTTVGSQPVTGLCQCQTKKPHFVGSSEEDPMKPEQCSSNGSDRHLLRDFHSGTNIVTDRNFKVGHVRFLDQPQYENDISVDTDTVIIESSNWPINKTFGLQMADWNRTVLDDHECGSTNKHLGSLNVHQENENPYSKPDITDEYVTDTQSSYHNVHMGRSSDIIDPSTFNEHHTLQENVSNRIQVITEEEVNSMDMDNMKSENNEDKPEGIELQYEKFQYETDVSSLTEDSGFESVLLEERQGQRSPLKPQVQNQEVYNKAEVKDKGVIGSNKNESLAGRVNTGEELNGRLEHIQDETTEIGRSKDRSIADSDEIEEHLDITGQLRSSRVEDVGFESILQEDNETHGQVAQTEHHVRSCDMKLGTGLPNQPVVPNQKYESRTFINLDSGEAKQEKINPGSLGVDKIKQLPEVDSIAQSQLSYEANMSEDKPNLDVPQGVRSNTSTEGDEGTKVTRNTDKPASQSSLKKQELTQLRITQAYSYGSISQCAKGTDKAETKKLISDNEGSKNETLVSNGHAENISGIYINEAFEDDSGKYSTDQITEYSKSDAQDNQVESLYLTHVTETQDSHTDSLNSGKSMDKEATGKKASQPTIWSRLCGCCWGSVKYM